MPQYKKNSNYCSLNVGYNKVMSTINKQMPVETISTSILKGKKNTRLRQVHDERQGAGEIRAAQHHQGQHPQQRRLVHDDDRRRLSPNLRTGRRDALSLFRQR